ncbi:MAG: sigma-70 family RNA polymerase sigma factor [Armatimonadetes bacterium]|nr:sigma-70 family RNA polymerase sigma factor [Armatimonadota bacterium]
MSESTRFAHDTDELVQRYLEYPRPELKDLILVQFAPMVERIARRFNGLEAQEDLVQVGYIGLLNALGKYDPAAGVRFNTYATHLVAGEIKHYLRDRSQTIRQPAWLQELRHKVGKTASVLQSQLGRTPTKEEIAGELGISASAVEEVFQTQELLKVASLDTAPVNDDDSGSEVDNLDAADFCVEQLSVEDRVVLERAIQQLRDLEREVLVLFHFESLNQTEIASKLGISCNYVSHILRQSLSKLRRILTSEELSDRALKRQANVLDDAVLDNLTGVYNHEYFVARVSEETHRANSSGSALSAIGVSFEGIDELKSFYGEVCVRDFLFDAAEFLKTNVRRLDVVCRFGKTGFAIILPHTGPSTEVVVYRLNQRFEQWLRERRAPSGPIRVVLNSVVLGEGASTAQSMVEAITPSESGQSGESDLAFAGRKAKRKVA